MSKRKLNDLECEMELSEQMVEKLKELFDIEIEMLQGKIEKLENGLTRYTIKVSQEKGELIGKLITHVMFNHLDTSDN